ncbi:MAG TPA: DRTGG domain-containing protein [Bacteroidales bacterium]|nr:DRTGG domain-containing protein [Bacteroidales bacterium]
MKITDIITELDLKVISGSNGLSNNITGGYVSDLLSDVMGNAKEGQVWITLQTHQNIIAVSSLKDIAAIIIVKGFSPEADTIEKSNIENIPVLSTELDTFNITGKLFELLKRE